MKIEINKPIMRWEGYLDMSKSRPERRLKVYKKCNLGHVEERNRWGNKAPAQYFFWKTDSEGGYGGFHEVKNHLLDSKKLDWEYDGRFAYYATDLTLTVDDVYEIARNDIRNKLKL